MSDDNLVNLFEYKKEKTRIKSLIDTTDLSKLTYSQLAGLVQSLGKLVEHQSTILNELLTSTAMLNTSVNNIQDQFMYVSGQAYLSLEILKSKGIITAAEVETLWNQIIEEKINSQQSSNIPVE